MQVKQLEELGIGRPSSYAPSLRTLQVLIFWPVSKSIGLTGPLFL